jgi:hypothetical protein
MHIRHAGRSGDDTTAKLTQSGAAAHAVNAVAVAEDQGTEDRELAHGRTARWLVEKQDLDSYPAKKGVERPENGSGIRKVTHAPRHNWQLPRAATRMRIVLSVGVSA